MALEDRNGRLYYYRKRREGRRVVSEYVGGGFIGELASQGDMISRCETEQKRRELQKVKASAAKVDERINEAEKFTQAMTRAALLLAGYHAPKRQWRKRRNG